MAKRAQRSARRWWIAVVALVALAAIPLSNQSAAQPKAIVTDAEITVDGDETRFRVTVDRPIEFHVFALADPYRVIIDLQEVEFDLPQSAGEVGDGLVDAFRFGLFSSGRSRIVIDATGPVEIAEPEIHPGRGGRPAQLIVSLGKTSRGRFLNEIALNGAPREGAAATASIEAVIASQVVTPVNDRPVVVVDPGHGGIDSGARSASGLLEKDIILEFAKTLVEKLQSSGRFKVVMTRSGDTFISLNARRALARRHNADLFISIHADSIRRSGIRGATVYTLSNKASDEEAAALAATENRSDAIAGVPLEEYSNEVGDILIDLAGRVTRKESKVVADAIVKSLRGRVRLNRNPVRSAGFVVLKEHSVPSVLVELGYLSNQQDEQAMRSTDWRDGASEAIVTAISGFFAPKRVGAK